MQAEMVSALHRGESGVCLRVLQQGQQGIAACWYTTPHDNFLSWQLCPRLRGINKRPFEQRR